MKKDQDTAILFFTRTAKNEAAVKSWTSIPDLDYQIASTLINRTRKRLQTAPFPVFPVEENQQKGNSFGEKLSNAFKLIFDKGFRYVIAIGNDCQNFSPDWLQIQEQLSTGRTVLGPDLRGGVYLLGISSDQNYNKIFKHISWNTNQVFGQLKQYFHNHYSIEYKPDINSGEDLKSDVSLADLIKSFLKENFWHCSKEIIINSSIPFHQSLRAPPII